MYLKPREKGVKILKMYSKPREKGVQFWVVEPSCVTLFIWRWQHWASIMSITILWLQSISRGSVSWRKSLPRGPYLLVSNDTMFGYMLTTKILNTVLLLYCKDLRYGMEVHMCNFNFSHLAFGYNICCSNIRLVGNINFGIRIRCKSPLVKYVLQIDICAHWLYLNGNYLNGNYLNGECK